MKTHFSDVLLLKLTKEFGTLEIWTNREPKTYHAGKIQLGSEGERDVKAIQGFIEQGFLQTVSIASNCELYQITPEGEALLRSYSLL